MSFWEKALGVTQKALKQVNVPALIKAPNGDGLAKDWQEKIAYYKTRAFIYEVQRYVGLFEEGSNKGQMIERFQRAVDGKATQEAYCLGGIFYAADSVDEEADFILEKKLSVKCKLFRTENVLACWNNTPVEQRVLEPYPGVTIVYLLYENGISAGAGHIETVLSVIDKRYAWTMGFNTSPPVGSIPMKEGSWVKKRDYTVKSGNMRVHGFLKAW